MWYTFFTSKSKFKKKIRTNQNYRCKESLEQKQFYYSRGEKDIAFKVRVKESEDPAVKFFVKECDPDDEMCTDKTCSWTGIGISF